MSKDEALKMAIESFELEESTWWPHTKMSKAYNACKEALATNEDSLLVQPAQEPNCYGDGNVYRGLRSEDSKVKTYHVKNYPKEWQGLSDDEVLIICAKMATTLPNKEIDLEFARAIQQALKELNHF